MRRLAARLAAAIAAPALFSLAPPGLVGGVGPPTCALAQGAAHVAIVVQHNDGRPERRLCATFEGLTATAEQALASSGLEYRTAYYAAVQGDALCQVDGEPGSPGPWTSDNCLGSSYWGVYVWRTGGPWSSSPVGISDLRLSDGDALGLTFGSRPPVPAGPQGICPASQPPPAAAGPSAGAQSGAAAAPGRVGRAAGQSAGASSSTTASAASAAGVTQPGQPAGSAPLPRHNGPKPRALAPARARTSHFGGASMTAAIAAALSDRDAGLMAALVVMVAMTGLLLYQLLASKAAP